MLTFNPGLALTGFQTTWPLQQSISKNQSKCENNASYYIKLDSCTVVIVRGSLSWFIFKSNLNAFSTSTQREYHLLISDNTSTHSS